MGSLNRIEIKGFKSIREMDLELHPLNVLIGANGAGKSNFISVFKLLNNIVENNLQGYVGKSGGADPFLYLGRKNTDELLVRLNFGRNGYEAKLGPSSQDTLIFLEESCWGQGIMYPRPFVVDLGRGHKETSLIEEAKSHSGGVASHVLSDLRSWKVYHFHDTSDSAKVKQTGDIDDNEVLRADASNLAAFLFLLRSIHGDYYERIVRTIRLAAPFFEDFVLRPSPLNPKKIQLEWRQRGSEEYFGPSAISDGTLRFMCLTTLLLQPFLPSTVLIDEPELGLHPSAIVLLTDMLQSAAAKTQVIVSTQSVPLVNQFSPEDVIVVDRLDSESVFRRLSAGQIGSWLDEYSIGELWEKNLLGGKPQ